MTLQPLRLTLLLALAACAPSDSGADSGKDSDTSTTTLPCSGGASTPILLASGAPSGFETCADGSIHRATAETMDPTINLPACEGDEEELNCTSDADCTGGPHGKCVSGDYFDYYDSSAHTICGCDYSCATDADCSEGEACVPQEAATGGLHYATCVPATCATDADCESGTCGLSDWNDGCEWLTGLYCRDEAVDTCAADADCEQGETCDFDEYATTEAWACVSETCAIGRPLTTEHGPRIAAPVARSDWREVQAPTRLGALSAAERQALARHWRSVGALEHASIGSFARFTLQLLAIGAPPDLVADTQTAAADEVRHARIAYGLASAYGGADAGPGPMHLADAMPTFDVPAIVRGLITEACVGETFGAAEALYAASGCEDEVVAAALREIAMDEARHAALAWRTLSWLRGEHPELPVAAWLEEALASVAVDVDATSALADGVLGGADRQAAHRAAIAEVIRPTIARLFGEG